MDFKNTATTSGMLVDEKGSWSNFLVYDTHYDLIRSIMFILIERVQFKKRLQGV